MWRTQKPLIHLWSEVVIRIGDRNQLGNLGAGSQSEEFYFGPWPQESLLFNLLIEHPACRLCMSG